MNEWSSKMNIFFEIIAPLNYHQSAVVVDKGKSQKRYGKYLLIREFYITVDKADKYSKAMFLDL